MGVWLTKNRATNWLGLLIALSIVYALLYSWVFVHDSSMDGELFILIASTLGTVIGYFMKGECSTCAAKSDS